MTEKENKWLQALIDAKKVLEKFNCKYFLDTGTLLGAVRDKRFIPWDSDIDIGVVNSKFDRKIVRAMANDLYLMGYNVTAEICGVNYTKLQTDISVGIKFYYEDAASYYGYLGKIEGGKMASSLYLYLSNNFVVKKGYGKYRIIGIVANIIHNLKLLVPTKLINRYLLKKMKYEEVRVSVNKEYFEELDNYEFYGETFSVPKNPDKYLSYRYGNDWTVPNDKYNYLKDDKSIK